EYFAGYPAKYSQNSDHRWLRQRYLRRARSGSAPQPAPAARSGRARRTAPSPSRPAEDHEPTPPCRPTTPTPGPPTPTNPAPPPLTDSPHRHRILTSRPAQPRSAGTGHRTSVTNVTDHATITNSHTAKRPPPRRSNRHAGPKPTRFSEKPDGAA